MTTSTATWLQSKDWVDAALVLLIEGLPYAFTNNEDLTALSSAWSTATSAAWPTVRGGLSLSGSVERRIEMFNAQVQPSSMTFSVLDVDDVLTTIMFGEASSSIQRADLSLSLDSSSLVVPFAIHNATLQPGVGDIYIGTETILVTADTGAFYVASDRGYRSIGGTSTLANHFGRPHEISASTGDTPEITSLPTAFYNRGVALFICHRVNGVWSAGFPGSSSNDAELLWSGRIKSWAEDGEGTIDLDCVEVTERLQTSLMSRQFTGKLSNGITPTAGDTVILTRVTSTFFDLATPAAGITGYTDGNTTWDGAGEFLSIDEIVSNINAKLVSLFVTDTPGVYGPNGVSVFLSGLDADGKLTFGVSWPTATSTLLNAESVRVEVFLHQSIWELLGFGAQMFTTIGGERSVLAETSFVNPHVAATVVATNQPAGRIIKEDGTMEITPDSSKSSYIAFTPQSSIPREIDSNTTAIGGTVSGFLIVGDDILLAVEQTAVTTFKIKLGGVVGSVHGQNGVLDGDISPFFGSGNNVSQLFQANATDLPVRQVWLETLPMGEMFLKLMVSTGTAGYNHPTHDYFPAWMGAGIPWTMIDADSVLGLEDTPYTLLVTKPASLSKLLESAMNFAGKTMAFIDGRITIIATTIGDNGDADLITLDETNKAKPITAAGMALSDRTTCARSPTGVLNRITLKYNADLGGSFKRTVTVNAVTSQSDYEQIKSAVVEGLGIYQGNRVLEDASIDGWETNTVASALAEFSKPVAIATRSYDFSLVTRLFPGTRVSLTDNALFDPATGSRGAIGILGWCLSTNFDWATGTGRTEIVFQPSRASSRSASMGPSARNDSTVNTGGFSNGYSTSTKTLQFLARQYSDSTSGVDVSNFVIGDKVQISELDPDDGSDIQSWVRTITAVDTVNNRVSFDLDLDGYGSGGATALVALLTSNLFTTATGTKTTASITVTAGALIVVGIFTSSTNEPFNTNVPVVSGCGITFARAEGTLGRPQGSPLKVVRAMTVFTGVVPVTVTGTLTFTFGDPNGGGVYSVAQVTGQGTQPIVQTAHQSVDGPGTSYTALLPVQAQATNITISYLASDPAVFGVDYPASFPPTQTTLGSGGLFSSEFLSAQYVTGAVSGIRTVFASTTPINSPSGLQTIVMEIGSPSAKPYVMEYAPITQCTSLQRSKAAFLADAATKSTGLAARDAYTWGGDVPNISTAFDATVPYQRANLSNDDQGSCLSVHKLSTINDWANTAFCYHLAPVYANELFPGGLVTSSSDYVTVWGPVWVPIYHAKRRIEFRALVASTGFISTGSFRLGSSRKLPSGTGFSNPTYIDIDPSSTTQPNWVNTPGFLTASPSYVTGTIGAPSTGNRNAQRGTYLTFDVAASGGIKLYSLYIGQVLETLF